MLPSFQAQDQLVKIYDEYQKQVDMVSEAEKSTNPQRAKELIAQAKAGMNKLNDKLDYLDDLAPTNPSTPHTTSSSEGCGQKSDLKFNRTELFTFVVGKAIQIR